MYMYSTSGVKRCETEDQIATKPRELKKLWRYPGTRGRLVRSLNDKPMIWFPLLRNLSNLKFKFPVSESFLKGLPCLKQNWLPLERSLNTGFHILIYYSTRTRTFPEFWIPSQFLYLGQFDPPSHIFLHQKYCSCINYTSYTFVANWCS